MLALTTDPAAPTLLALTEVADPEPSRHQVLVQVAAVSVNPTDRHLVRVAPPGTVAGAEAAGVVLRAAQDGSGPDPGTPVITLGPGGGWAQLRAVDVAALGVVPAGVDLAAASTLPVAATSALRALRALGPVLGRRVLVTGATGAVGRFAVQLAHLGGAYVLAAVRDGGTAGHLLSLGADEVLTDGPGYATDPVHGVIESVGGAHLVGAFDRLAAGGTLVSVGRASGEPAVFAAEDLLGDGSRHDRSLRTFFLGDGSAGLDLDLTWLAARLGDDSLRAHYDVRSPWTEARDADGPLGEAAPGGKVVLDVT